MTDQQRQLIIDVDRAVCCWWNLSFHTYAQCVVCGVAVVGAVVLVDVGEIEDHFELLRLPVSGYVCVSGSSRDWWRDYALVTRTSSSNKWRVVVRLSTTWVDACSIRSERRPTVRSSTMNRTKAAPNVQSSVVKSTRLNENIKCQSFTAPADPAMQGSVDPGDPNAVP